MTLQVFDLLPRRLRNDLLVGILPFAVQFPPLEESVQEHRQSADLRVWLVRHGHVPVGHLVDLEGDLLGTDDDKKGRDPPGGPDRFHHVLDRFPIHREMYHLPGPRTDPTRRRVGRLRLERPAEPIGDVGNGSTRIGRVVREDHPVGTQGPGRQPDVGGHPVVPTGAMTETEDDDVGFILHICALPVVHEEVTGSPHAFAPPFRGVAMARTRPEAVAGVEDVDLSDAIAVVTGATDGIGRETALGLGRLGARVIVHGRDEHKAERTVRAIEWSGGEAEAVLADFLDESAVHELADTVLDTAASLDILINNAGATFRSGELTAAGVERTMAVNHVAPFVLTNRLAPALETAGGRIVTVASQVHRRVDEGTSIALDAVNSYGQFDAYARSKFANIVFTYELARRLESATTTCLHPGFVPGSALWRDGNPFVRWTFRLVGTLPDVVQNTIGKSPAVAAGTPVYLAAAPGIDDVTGEYFADMEPRRSAAETYDQDLQETLWDRTVASTSLDREAVLPPQE